MDNYRILCIDDDADFLAGFKLRFKSAFHVVTAIDLQQGLAALRAEPIDLVLLDINLGKEDGLEGLDIIRKSHPSVDVAILTGQRDLKTVVKAIRAGAMDYLTKPFEADDIEALIERQMAGQKVRERYSALVEAQNNGFKGDIIHRSNAVSRILEQAEHLKGHQNANVLIVGETGTGKELLARYIHKIEGDTTRPFVAVNCAAIPENLIESELFGSEAGAYTGSVKRRIGKFELGDGGDVFLDEVSSLKPDLQAKILRVLQEHEFCRVGGNEVIKADFRVIAATNELLEERVSRGEFRMDLYHRLRVIQLEMPPLRDRMDDIPALVQHYLGKYAKDGFQKRMSPGAMARLMAYHWPGNVRELANVVQSLTILAPGLSIDESIFPAWVLNGCTNCGVGAPVQFPVLDASVGSLRDYVNRAEKHYIEYALRACDNDKSKTARHLSLGRTTLYGKMKELGLM